MVSVVIVDQTNSIDSNLLHAAADALNYQVSAQLSSVWAGISANVSYAPSITALPPHSWPVFLVASLPPGEGGFHQDNHNQPYAKVIASPGDDSWTIDASHEIIEMLVDPFGNRMQSSQAITVSGGDIVDSDGVYNYLVEACDPCEANEFGYDINGVVVSDFITPHYYDASVTPGTKYSYKGNLQRPRQMLKGGYISFVTAAKRWEQILWVDPNAPPELKELGPIESVRSLRLTIHKAMGEKLDIAKHFQRRKRDGLSEDLRTRVSAYRNARSDVERKAMLENWYDLDTTQP